MLRNKNKKMHRFIILVSIIRQFQPYFRSCFAIFSSGIFTNYIFELLHFVDEKHLVINV